MRVPRPRRDRLAHVVVLQRLPRYERQARLLRESALLVLLLVTVVSSHRWSGLAWCTPAALVTVSAGHRLPAVVGHADQPTPWRWAAWVAVTGTTAVVPSRVTVDLPVLWCLVSLAAALTLFAAVTSSILTHPSWYDPERPGHLVPELVRLLAGPLGVAAAAAIALPGPWPRGTYACAVLTLIPLLTHVRVRDVDHLLRQAVPLLREQGQRGRDAVLREIHGTLSTQLRRLEQEARQYRSTLPVLHELAVDANSGLRETLTLAEEHRDTSTATDTLVAPVLTLTRAEGATATTLIEVGQLGDSDRVTARYVLNELVRLALDAGAARLQVAVSREARRLVVIVVDDAPAAASTSSRDDDVDELRGKLRRLAGDVSLRRGPDGTSRLAQAHWLSRAEPATPDPLGEGTTWT